MSLGVDMIVYSKDGLEGPFVSGTRETLHVHCLQVSHETELQVDMIFLLGRWSWKWLFIGGEDLALYDHCSHHPVDKALSHMIVLLRRWS